MAIKIWRYVGMKLSGSITVKNVKLPGQQEGNDVVINYEVSFGIGEVGQAINLMDTIVDKVADAHRKFKKYDEEFNPPQNKEEQDTKEYELTQEEIDEALAEAKRSIGGTDE